MDNSRRSRKGWSVFPNRWYEEGTEPLFFWIHSGIQTFLWIQSFSQLDLKSRARMPFFLYPFILIALFTLSPTLLFPPPRWASQENSMCTFSLIKGLDTLPYPRRKAPFISPYWICLSVSVLFNFALPFVFITGQQRESVGNRDNGTRSLSVPPWAMIRLGWSALPTQCSALSFHHRWHPDPPQITRKHPWPLTVATHWLKGQKQQVSVLVIMFFVLLLYLDGESEQRAIGVCFQCRKPS